MHAYIINLARSADQHAHITTKSENIGIDYEIVAAVDGQDLDLNNIVKIDPAFLEIEYPAGAAGCALSHLSVYTKIIADGLDKALHIGGNVSSSLPTY